MVSECTNDSLFCFSRKADECRLIIAFHQRVNQLIQTKFDPCCFQINLEEQAKKSIEALSKSDPKVLKAVQTILKLLKNNSPKNGLWFAYQQSILRLDKKCIDQLRLDLKGDFGKGKMSLQRTAYFVSVCSKVWFNVADGKFESIYPISDQGLFFQPLLPFTEECENHTKDELCSECETDIYTFNYVTTLETSKFCEIPCGKIWMPISDSEYSFLYELFGKI